MRKLLIIKFTFIVFVLTDSCFAQQWQAEVMAGVSAYNGDLTKKWLSAKTVKPAVNFNLKYDLDNRLVLRAGITWANIAADDRDNNDFYLKLRKVNFKSTVLEGSVCAEINLFEPEVYVSYPYVF